MSTIETVLVFIGIPVAVMLVVFGLVLGGTTRRVRRYRPGRPFEFTPVWFLSAPPAQLGGTQEQPELGGGERLALSKSASSGATSPQHTTGGASDRW